MANTFSVSAINVITSRSELAGNESIALRRLQANTKKVVSVARTGERLLKPAERQDHDREAPNWNPFCNLQGEASLDQGDLAKAAACRASTMPLFRAAASTSRRALNRVDVMNRVFALQPVDVIPKLTPESPAFRDELLGLCLRLLLALTGFPKRVGPGGERVASERYDSIQADFSRELCQLIIG